MPTEVGLCGSVLWHQLEEKTQSAHTVWVCYQGAYFIIIINFIKKNQSMTASIGHLRICNKLKDNGFGSPQNISSPSLMRLIFL